MYTAIMASRPDEPFIDTALESIANQSLSAHRTIVVINGPIDSITRAASSLGEEHDFPEIVLSPKASMAHAFRTALLMVDTPYVSFLDSDDEWFPNKQQHHIDFLDSHPAIEVVIGSTVNFREDTSGRRIFEKPVSGRVFGACTFRAEVFLRYGMPDDNAQHFTWLYRWWSTADSAGIRTEHLDDPVLKRRIHQGNGWVTDRLEGHRQLLAEVRRIHSQRSTS